MMMRRSAILGLLGAISLLLVLGAGGRSGAASRGQPEQPVRFESIDIYIDAGEVPLAAYQVEVRALGGDAKLVGIKGGEPSAYAEPPYYDPRALQEGHERIVIAALARGELPVGRIRVARLQMAVRGNAEYRVRLEAAGASDGRRIEATADASPSEP